MTSLRREPSEPNSLRRRFPFALAALYVVVGAIALCAYLISAWQVFGFAEHVWRLPLELCVGAAVVADLLSLAGLFATYQLRRAPLFVRLYAWFVFLIMTGLSIGAAESYASWRFAPEHAKPNMIGDARVASAAIVIALALAAHMLIICRNHIGEDASHAVKPGTPRWWQPAPKPKPAQQPPPPRPADKQTPAPRPEPPALPPAPARKDPTPARKTQASTPETGGKATGRGRKVDAAEQARRDQVALRVITADDTREAKRQAAATHHVSVRAIELWIAAYRDRHPINASPERQRPDLKNPMLGPDTTHPDQHKHTAEVN